MVNARSASPHSARVQLTLLERIQNMTVMAYACRRRTADAAECVSLSYRSPRVAQGLARRTLSPRWPYSRIGPGELNAFAGPLPLKVTPAKFPPAVSLANPNASVTIRP